MKCDQIWNFFPHCTWVAHFSSQWLSFLWIFDPRWGISNSTTSNAGANRQFCGPALFFKHFRNIFEILFEIFLRIWCHQSNPREIWFNLICYTWGLNWIIHEWEQFSLTLNSFQMHFLYGVNCWTCHLLLNRWSWTMRICSMATLWFKN